MKRPFAVIGFTLFFTIAILFKLEIGVAIVLFFVFIAALIMSLLFKNIRKNGLLPTVFSSGAIACVLLICSNYFVYLPVLSFDGRKNCAIKAEITDLPKIEYGNYYYNTRVISVDGEKTDMKVRLSFSTPPEAEPYDIIEGNFNFYALGMTNENVMLSYKAQGLYLGAYPVNEGFSVVDVEEKNKPFMKKILDIRESIIDAIYHVMPDERGDLAVALIIGDRSGLDNEIYSDFQKTGISHIICVSGYHLSLWSMIILKILKKTKINDRSACVIAAAGILFFMLVSGMTYSVVRSGIMMFIFLFRNMIMRRSDSMNSLGFALSLMAVINPFSIGSVSLQLSALATMGIIFYSLYVEPDIEALINKIKHNIPRKAIDAVIGSLMVTFSATAFTLPLSLMLYRSFNYICFFANLIAVPVSSFCMVISSIAAFFGTVLSVLFNPFTLVGGLSAEFLINFAHKMAEYDFLTFRLNVNQSLILLSGIFVFCIIALFISSFKKPVYSLSVLMVTVLFTVSTVTMSYFNKNETKITVFDVGASTSVLISHKDENMLIGCGGTEFSGPNSITEAIYETGGGIDVAAILSTEEGTDSYSRNVFSEYKPQVLFFDKLPEGVELMTSKTKKYNLDKLNLHENISVKSEDISNNYCVYVCTEDVSVLICFDPVFDFSLLPSEFQNADLIISKGNFPKSETGYNSADLVLISEKERAEYIRKSYLEKGLDMIYTGGEGDIIIRAENGCINIERE